MALRSVRMEKSIKGEKNMKKKLMRMPKVVTILVAVLIVAIFLGSMDVAAFFSCRYSFRFRVMEAV